MCENELKSTSTSDMKKTVKFSKADLKKQMNINDNFSNVTGGMVVSWVAEAASIILKKSPLGITLLMLQTILKADSALIAQKIKYMGQHGYSYFVTETTYKYVGYQPGSSYPTYRVKSQSYWYE